jgi:hypothetical protein
MLMEEFMKNGYRGKELRELNKCHLFLQCTTLADIVNGKGDKLLMAAIHCHRSTLLERRQYEWPTQPAPNQSQKLLCRKALHKCFTRHRHSLVLRQPLGTWHSPPSHIPRYDPEDKMFYIPSENGQWQQVKKEPLRQQQDPSWMVLRTTYTQYNERYIYQRKNGIIRNETSTMARKQRPQYTEENGSTGKSQMECPEPLNTGQL